MGVMRGRVFEKVGRERLHRLGQALAASSRRRVPGAEAERRFWASGISLVAHLRSPHCPPAHMNTRHIRTARAWFGGGADLNPIYPGRGRHRRLPRPAQGRLRCQRSHLVSALQGLGRRVLLHPHRNEARGVGGIFYDYLEDDIEQAFAFTQVRGRGLPRHLPAAGAPAHGPALDGRGATAPADPPRALRRVQPPLRSGHTVRAADRRQPGGDLDVAPARGCLALSQPPQEPIRWTSTSCRPGATRRTRSTS